MRAAYQALIGQGWVTPADFWKLRPGEVWMIFKSKAPPAENEKWASLYDLLKGSKDE